MKPWLTGLLSTVISFFIVQFAQAQHNNVWFRTTLSFAAPPKMKVDAEFQHRRQSGMNSSNMFDENLMYSFRSWVHYQYDKNLKLSVSPFAYFSNYRIIQKQSDLTASDTREVRFSAAADFQHRLFGKLFISDRAAAEYRIFENSQKDILRLRNKLGLRYDLTKKLKTGVYAEFLFNLAGTTSAHFFDHRRLGINLEYRLLKNLKTEIAYIYISRVPLSAVQKIYENNIYLGLTVDIGKKS